MSDLKWWSICRRNATGDPLDGSCPECRHSSMVHPGSHNPGVRGCVFCALDQLDGSWVASVGLLGEMTAAELDEVGGIEEDA